MDLARRIYSRELKLAAMREIDDGRTVGEVARLLELSPNLLQRWRGEWQAPGHFGALPSMVKTSSTIRKWMWSLLSGTAVS